MAQLNRLYCTFHWESMINQVLITEKIGVGTGSDYQYIISEFTNISYHFIFIWHNL